jgi:hypothetical protein
MLIVYKKTKKFYSFFNIVPAANIFYFEWQKLFTELFFETPVSASRIVAMTPGDSSPVFRAEQSIAWSFSSASSLHTSRGLVN